MPRPKTRKINKTFSLDPECLEALELRCKKEKVNVSTFINFLIRKNCMDEYTYYANLAVHHAAQLHKYRTLADMTRDKPKNR